jgi:hypothetical protein
MHGFVFKNDPREILLRPFDLVLIAENIIGTELNHSAYSFATVGAFIVHRGYPRIKIGGVCAARG